MKARFYGYVWAAWLILALCASVRAETEESKVIYCYGDMPETAAIERSWFPDGTILSREQKRKLLGWRAQTIAGELTSHSRVYPNTLWLNDKKLAEADHISLIQAYKEDVGLPSIVIVELYHDDRSDKCRNNKILCRDVPEYYIVDVGVSPPFISKRYIPIGIDTRPNGHTATGTRSDCIPYAKGVTIKKLDANTYSFSGKSFEEKDVNGEPADVIFIYDRKKKTIEKR